MSARKTERRFARLGASFGFSAKRGAMLLEKYLASSQLLTEFFK